MAAVRMASSRLGPVPGRIAVPIADPHLRRRVFPERASIGTAHLVLPSDSDEEPVGIR
jgi:hypothetical protein